MSAHKLKITLSPTAKAELKGILNFTGQTWGAEQRELFKQTLWSGFRNIAAYPFIGESRPEYGEGVRSRLIEMYVVIYEPTEREIYISRIVHQRRALGLLIGKDLDH